MRTRLHVLPVLALAAFGLSACSGGGAAGVTLVGTEFAFAPNVATATAGEVALTLDNQGEAPHSVAIEGVDGDADLISMLAAGEQKSASVTLTAGTYTVYCSIAGHREAGMEATLTVE